MIVGDYFKNHGYVHNELTFLMYKYDLSETIIKRFLKIDSVEFRFIVHSKVLEGKYRRLLEILNCLIVCNYDLNWFLDELDDLNGVPF